MFDRSGETVKTNIISVPNILSGFRLVAAPILLYLAWNGYPKLFLALLAISLLSDSIDGFLARRLRKETELGTKLDSYGDLATYLSVPLCAWWLWPDILKREAVFVFLVLGAYIIPILVGLLKFKRITSYHTWLAKITAVLMSVAVLMLFLWDIPWPFRCVAVLQVIEACEEIAITLSLSQRETNIPTYWHLIRRRQKDKAP
jgi:CDP-diacylglycerol--glycerol-3-phosphate 3-phosphatidyltransferase